MNNTIQNLIAEISFNGFTAAQMRTMLCAAVENMTESQAAALLDTIGMELSDVI